MIRSSVARRSIAAALGGLLAASAALGLLGGAHAKEDDTLPAALLAWQARVAEGETASHVQQAALLPSLPAREVSYPALPERPAYTVYFPEGPDVPRQTVVALHGMGGSGPGLASQLLGTARANGWVLVAPTIPYGEWRDPVQLTGEELRLMPQINNLIDYARDEAGVQMEGRVMLFGFSRGAQAALRFSMLYPDRVEAVAALSAGTYTLPVKSVLTASGPALAPLPFGVADLEQLAGRGIDQFRMSGVRYLIEVGANDNRDGDVPRQWDPFVGKNRVERAARFAAVLNDLGCETSLAVIPGAGHELNAAMLEQANGFLTASAARALPHVQLASLSTDSGLSGYYIK